MHDHTHQHNTQNIRLAFFLNLGFTILEIIGGIWTNSLAIIADAIHDLGDSFALGLAWYLEKISQKKGDTTYSYGYRRFSLLGAVISALILIIGSLFVLSEAIPRLINPEPTHATGMLLFAIVGIVVNGVAVYRLKGNKGLNAKMITWHLLEDVLGWVAIFIVSVVLLFEDIYILDPILSILITGYILFNVIKNLKKTVSVFLQAVPDEKDIQQLETELVAIDGVESIHHTHVWSLDGEHHVVTAHIVVNHAIDKAQLLHLRKSINTIIDKHDFSHSTIEIEFSDEDCRIQTETCR